MSYAPPNQYPPNQYPPQPGHSPQPGHHAHPLQQGYPPPQLQGYPPQQGHSPQPGYQGYPPPQPQQGYPPLGPAPPPQQGYGTHYQQAYPSQQGYAPQGQYPLQQQCPSHGQHAPQHGYGQQPGPPHSGQYQTQQPAHVYGAPPQSMPTPPTPGYGPLSQPLPDAFVPASDLRKAMKGFGTNEAAIIQVLAHYPGEAMDHLKNTYQQQNKRALETDIAKETSGYFETGLLSILHGPLMHDVHTLHKALAGAGTNEALLNDVLLGRSNADMRAIKNAYQSTYKHSPEGAVAGDLSAKTERLFSMVLSATRAEESAPCIPQAIELDVNEIHKATEAKIGADQLVVCSILSSRSNGQIRAIAQTYEQRYGRSLEKVLESDFSGHMKIALVAMVRKACDKAMHDAIGLEETMAGMGTKDEMLVARVVSAHWDRNHMGQVKGAYQARYKKDLVTRVKSETSGDYEKLLVAMLN